MLYIIIGVAVYAIVVTLLLIFFEGTKHDEEKELELLFRYYDCLEQGRLSKIDAEIAYLESLYGVDDHVRGKE